MVVGYENYTKAYKQIKNRNIRLNQCEHKVFWTSMDV